MAKSKRVKDAEKFEDALADLLTEVRLALVGKKDLGEYAEADDLQRAFDAFNSVTQSIMGNTNG